MSLRWALPWRLLARLSAAPCNTLAPFGPGLAFVAILQLAVSDSPLPFFTNQRFRFCLLMGRCKFRMRRKSCREIFRNIRGRPK